MNVREQLELLGEIAEGQWGMLTSAQARERGITRLQLQRATESGNLERLAHGIYRIAGAPTDSYESLRTAWLAIEPTRTAEQRLADPQPSSVICGAAACWLHGIGDLDPVPYDIATPTRSRPRRDDVRTTTRRLQPDDVTIVHGLPVTTIERTVVDLILDHVDDEHLLTIATDAPRLDLRKIDEYVDAAAVRRRARARAKARKIRPARANTLLEELYILSPEVQEQLVRTWTPAFERMKPHLTEAMRPMSERLAETFRPAFERLAAETPIRDPGHSNRLGRTPRPPKHPDAQDHEAGDQ